VKKGNGKLKFEKNNFLTFTSQSTCLIILLTAKKLMPNENVAVKLKFKLKKANSNKIQFTLEI
jgi:hypothetical protein